MWPRAIAGISTATSATANATTAPRRCLALLAPIGSFLGPETYIPRTRRVLQSCAKRLADLLRAPSAEGNAELRDRRRRRCPGMEGVHGLELADGLGRADLDHPIAPLDEVV